MCNSGVHKSLVPGHPDDQIVLSGILYFFVFIKELASCYTYGAWNFEVAARFLENFCTRHVVYIYT